MGRPEIRVGINKCAASESLYLLENFIKPCTNSKEGIKQPETQDALFCFSKRS